MDLNSLLFFSAMGMIAASPDNGADRALLNAYLKQSGIERQANEFQKREVSKRNREYIGFVAFIGKALVDKRITVQWRF